MSLSLFGDSWPFQSQLIPTAHGAGRDAATQPRTMLGAVDIKEDEKTVQLLVDCPGIAPQDIKVQIADGALTISGERVHQEEEGGPDAHYHRIERSYGKFSRSFALPPTVAEDADIQANVEHGVLKVTLQKGAPEKKVRSITVN